MKKIDLIHTTILIVALLAGYAAIQHVLYLLTALIRINSYSDTGSDRLLYYLVMILGYSMACLILVMNGRNYAGSILKKDEPETFLEDAPKWDLDRQNILMVLFIGMGLHTLIQSIPYMLVDLYDIFNSRINPLLQESGTAKSTIALELLRLTIGTLLIYAAPTLTNFIERTIAVRLGTNDSKK